MNRTKLVDSQNRNDNKERKGILPVNIKKPDFVKDKLNNGTPQLELKDEDIYKWDFQETGKSVKAKMYRFDNKRFKPISKPSQSA